jgi:hypothetical protein
MKCLVFLENTSLHIDQQVLLQREGALCERIPVLNDDSEELTDYASLMDGEEVEEQASDKLKMWLLNLRWGNFMHHYRL